MLIFPRILFNPVVWLVIILLIHFLIKRKDRLDENKLTEEVKEARKRTKNVMVPLIILYGLFTIGAIFAHADYAATNSRLPFRPSLGGYFAVIAANLAIASILLYILSVSFLIHFKKNGRRLILLSAVLYIPQLIQFHIRSYQLTDMHSVIHFLLIPIPIIFILAPLYYFTRSKVKEQFK